MQRIRSNIRLVRYAFPDFSAIRTLVLGTSLHVPLMRLVSDIVAAVNSALPDSIVGSSFRVGVRDRTGGRSLWSTAS